MKYIKINKEGRELIQDPIFNKGTAFTENERKEFKLNGLLPPDILSIKTQAKRIMRNYSKIDDDLEKYIFLESLHDRNETLYYYVIMENIKELTPIIYTPTVGKACQTFGDNYRSARGMYCSIRHKGKLSNLINNWPHDDVEIIVVTDGSRILGLGDLGVNGMGIPIGKLSLYVICAGIHPYKTLPVMLDVGTNNKELQNNEFYLGEKYDRIKDDQFYELVDEFIKSIFKRWPNALIQFEDFTNNHAFPLLDKYKNKILCFNDDIQGTGAVALSGILAALMITKENLKDQRIVFLGAGSAAIGIANTIVQGMVKQGISEAQAKDCFWFVDSNGLVTKQRKDQLDDHKLPYARNVEPIENLLDVIKIAKPTILLGLSGIKGGFSELVIKEMNKYTREPIIFALSNPTSKAECTLEQAVHWTNGSAIFASGSPFNPMKYKDKLYIPGQGNNMYIFPGIGLSAIVSRSKKITDEMFYIAAETLASMVSKENLLQRTVYPSIEGIREISINIAYEICKRNLENCPENIQKSENLKETIKQLMYVPIYQNYKKQSI